MQAERVFYWVIDPVIFDPAFDIQIVRRDISSKALKRRYAMSITRRQFILSTAGAAAGFILPSYYIRALEFLDQFGKPLLRHPEIITDDLFVRDEGSHLLMHLGDPELGPPEMTWREFLEEYHPYALEDPEGEWGVLESDLDELVDSEFVVESWARSDSPNAQAYYLLESLDLGPDLSGSDAVGGLVFTNCPMPGSDYLGVAAEDHVSISLLQQRLNDLGTGIRVVLC